MVKATFGLYRYSSYVIFSICRDLGPQACPRPVLKKALKEAVLENIVPNEREPLMALLREKAKELGVS